MLYIKNVNTNTQHIAYEDADVIFRLHFFNNIHLPIKRGDYIALHQNIDGAINFTQLVAIVDNAVGYDDKENPDYPHFLYVQRIVKGRIPVKNLKLWAGINFSVSQQPLIANFAADETQRAQLEQELFEEYFKYIHENLQFKQKCILNFDQGFDWDTPIYRVYAIDRLTQVFNDNKNTLVKPSIWDDPFENLVFQQTATLTDGTPVSFDSIHQNFYGQCWTLNTEETDALWRIYSPNKDGVRVKTTLRKLFDNFYNPTYKWAKIAFYIGKINYKTSADIQTFFENPENLEMIFDTSGAGLVQTLLIKRTEFIHENEVRLIYFANSETYNTTNKLYQYNFNPNSILDELLFDPRFDDKLFAAKKAEFIAHGFTKTIHKSKLYQVPNFNLKINR
jgi:hypothetical protein